MVKQVDCKVVPVVACNVDVIGSNAVFPVQTLLDSGGAVSVVHEKLLAKTKHRRFFDDSKTYLAANGEKLGNGWYASFDLNLTDSDYVIRVKKALIQSKPGLPHDHVLLGTPTLTDQKIDLLFSRNMIQFQLFGVQIPMQKVRKPLHIREVQRKGTEKRVVEKPVDKNRVVADLVGKDAKSFKSDEAVCEWQQNPTVQNLSWNLDSRTEYKRRIEWLRQEKRDGHSMDDVEFDKEFCKEHPGIKEKVMKIIGKYPKVFENTTGCAPARYSANVRVEGEGAIPRKEVSNYSQKEKEAICQQFDEEFADGVLVFPDEHGIKVENVLQSMVVTKKDDEGNVIAWSNSARVVVTCNQRLNKYTKVPAYETDSLQEVSYKAAVASKHGFKCKFDIKKAFFNIPLDKSLWGHFAVVHPFLGIMVYTRCCMGWVGSMGLVRNAFLQMYAEFDAHMFRFMDDGFLFHKSELEFLAIFERFLKVTEFNNLRIKGSKLKMFQKEMNFLGVTISEGVIKPSPHQHKKAVTWTREMIKTKTDLRSYLGLCQFLARFMHRSTEVFADLRKIASKDKDLDSKNDGKKLIDWGLDNGKLVVAFENANKALRKLCKLRPFDPEKQPFIITDGSKIGQGAILAQKDHFGDFYIVELYSRKRIDSERVTKASSCMLEAAVVVGATNYWRRFIENSPFPTVVFTDSASFAALCKRFANNEIPSNIPMINGFFRDLLGLQLQVIHLAGKHVNIELADFMSRIENEPCDESKCRICKMVQLKPEAASMFVAQIRQLCIDMNGKLRLQDDPQSESIMLINHNDWLDVSPDEIANMPLEKVCEIRPSPNPFLVEHAVLPILRGSDKAVTVERLLTNTTRLAALQMQSPLLRQARKYIESGETTPPKKMRLDTLINKKKAKVVNDLVQYQKWHGLEQRNIIPIPIAAASLICTAIHNQFGCRSPSQMFQMFQRFFDMENAKTFVMEFTKRCRKCLLLRKENARKPLKLKEVEMPTKVGEIIYVDEIRRTDKGRLPIKIMFATDGFTRFGITKRYDDPLTSSKFIEFVTGVVAILSSLQTGKCNIICRTDGATQHTSEQTIRMLAQNGIGLEVHESTTLSKNSIPAQDARIKSLQKHLTVALNERDPNPDKAIFEATRAYNQQLTNLTKSPAELLFRRDLGGYDNIQVPDRLLCDKDKVNREKERQKADRRNEKLRKTKRLEIRQLTAKIRNDRQLCNEPRTDFAYLSEDDVVKLHKKYDKTDTNRFWRVHCIDWKSKTFEASKLNLKRKGKRKVFSFDAIDHVQTDYVRVLAEQLNQRRRRLLVLNGGLQKGGFDVGTTDLHNDVEDRIEFDDSGLEVMTPAPPTPAPIETLPQPVQIQDVWNPTFVAATPASPDTTANTTAAGQTWDSTLQSQFSVTGSPDTSSFLNDTALEQYLAADNGIESQPMSTPTRIAEKKEVKKRVKKVDKKPTSPVRVSRRVRGQDPESTDQVPPRTRAPNKTTSKKQSPKQKATQAVMRKTNCAVRFSKPTK